MRRNAVHRIRATRAGFTLLELMVVVVILGILLGVVAYSVKGKDDKAKVVAARLSIKGVENAIEMYKLDVGKYPDKVEDLLVQPSDAKNWSGPYLKDVRMPKDPWGKELLYVKPGEGGRDYDVLSLGRDGLPGGQSWDRDIRGSGEEDDKDSGS